MKEREIIGRTLLVTEARSLIERTTNSSKIRLWLQNTLLSGFQRLSGLNPLVEIDDELLTTSLSYKKAVKTAYFLKRSGFNDIIKKEENYPDEPKMYRFTKGNLGTGSDFFDKSSALWRCVGESTERHIWHEENITNRKKFIKKKAGELGDKSLNIFSLVGFTSEQKKDNPPLNIGISDYFGWVLGYSLTKKRGQYVPAQLINARYFRENVSDGKEKMLRWPITTGLATASTLEEAVLKGSLEVIERDAFMITYLNKISPPQVHLESIAEKSSDIAKIIDSFKRYKLELYVLDLPTDFKANTYAAIIIDRTGKGPAFTMGLKASFDQTEGILGAITEAHAIRLHLRKDFRKKIQELPEKKMFGQFDRMYYWSEIKNLPDISFLISGPIVTQRDKNAETSVSEKLISLVNFCRNKRYELLYVDISLPSIRKAGLRSAFVIIPELQPLHLDERIPYLGGNRLSEIPREFGFTPADSFNKEPHPFG